MAERREPQPIPDGNEERYPGVALMGIMDEDRERVAKALAWMLCEQRGPLVVDNL